MRGASLASLSVVVVLVVAMAAVPASALERGRGSYWTYSISTDVAGVNATGVITYRYEEARSVDIGGASQDVSVLSISGNASGSTTVLEIPYEVSLAFGGYQYETRADVAVLKTVVLTWTNISLGSTGFQLSTRTAEEVVTIYSPAFMSEFHPSVTGPGAVWGEGLQESQEQSINGTVVETSTQHMVYNFAIADQPEEIATGAGTLETLRITVTDDSSNIVAVYWWSSSVGYFAKKFSYSPGDSEPSSTMVLTAYANEGGLNMMLFTIIGGLTLALAVSVLVYVLLARKKQGKPAPAAQASQPKDASGAPPKVG